MNKGTLNRAMLIGRIGYDPKIRYTRTGKAVAYFSLATLQRSKDSNGQLIIKPEWHRVVVWNKLAEKCSGFLSKGTLVCIEGMIKTRPTGKSNQTLTEIIVTRINRILRQQVKNKPAAHIKDTAA